MVAYEEADRGGIAVGVADAQVGGVDGRHAAVGAADAVAALPARELQRVSDSRARAGSVRPGREVGEGFTDDLFGDVSEEVFRVLAPGGDGSGAVDLDDGDPHSAVGQREEVDGEGGARGAGAHRALGKGELEPDEFVRRRVVDAPAGGEGCAELEAAAALAVGVTHVDRGLLERDLALRIAVGDLDAYAVVGAQAQDLGGGAGVHDGVRHEFTGEDDRVVDDVGEAPPLEGVAHKGAGGRDGPPDGVEGGSRARGDHRTPCISHTSLDAHVSRTHGAAAPSDARRPRATALAGRTGVGGQPHARLLTFAVHADAGRLCFRPEGVRTVCEAAELLWPGSAMVKHWARFRREPEQSEQYGRPLREGHSGVWRSVARHEYARKGRTVPGETA